MFHHQFILCVCTISLALSSPQSYFHTTHGNGGSYTSISHGSGSPPVHEVPVRAQSRSYRAPAPTQHKPKPFIHHAQQPTTYNSPAPAAYHAPLTATYHSPTPTTYHSPAPPAYHSSAPSAYHSPAAPAYHAPAPSYHAPTHLPQSHGQAPNYSEKCGLDYVENPAEVCVPTLETECKQEDGGKGVELHQDEECHDVVRTVCVERHKVVDNEVCAYSYTLKPVVTEAKLVEAQWEKICHQDTICLNPHHVQTSYGAPTYCHEEIHEVCHLEPTLVPVIRPVSVSLPQPVEVCINKQVVLPFLECQKVKDRHCTLVPSTKKSYRYQIDKCNVVLGQPACQETVLQLPRQACLQRIDKIRTTYTSEEISYSG